MPAMSEGSPPPRCRSDGRNQFQHFVCPLRGVSHEAGLFFRDEVHPRAGGKILRRLRTAVEHDHQRNGLSVIAAWRKEPIGAASGGIFVGAFDEAGAVRHDVCHGRRGPPQRSARAEPGKVLGEIRGCAARARPNSRLGGVCLDLDGRRLSSCSVDGASAGLCAVRCVLAPKRPR